MNLERPSTGDAMKMWHFEDWRNAIQTADIDNKLAPYNDVVTGRDAPSAELSKHLVVRDVSLGGKTCDIYHWDQDEQGNKIRNSSSHRVFVHIKE